MEVIRGQIASGESVRHPCDFCEKTFKRKHHLTDHKKIHTQDWNYWCGQCKKGFLNPSKLKKHEDICQGKGINLAFIVRELSF